MFWDDPEEFIPERWDDEEKINKKSYMPFGLGERVCYGEKLSNLTIRLILLEIFRKAKISLAVPEEEIVGNEGLVLWPVNGLPLTITPRYELY